MLFKCLAGEKSDSFSRACEQMMQPGIEDRRYADATAILSVPRVPTTVLLGLDSIFSKLSKPKSAEGSFGASLSPGRQCGV
jgi:hypothetical protein